MASNENNAGPAAQPAQTGHLSWRDFTDFMNNPTIQQLAHECRWSISTTQPIETVNLRTGQPYVLPRKTPVDVRELTRGTNFRGAFSLDETCLMDLDELNEHFPHAVNNAFHVSAQVDEVLILDIEPTCPQHIVDQLLMLPSLYREVSMSGNGYHLVMPLPANFYEFPNAMAKAKLQHEHQWYEVLIEHWVTFTRKALDNPTATAPNPQPGSGPTWEQVYAGLASQVTQLHSSQIAVDHQMPQIPHLDEILDLVINKRKKYTRTLDDFHGDYSKWEFGHLGHLYNGIDLALSSLKYATQRDWSESDRVWLLYEAGLRALPSRDKHLQTRNGLPFLLYVATTMVTQRIDRDKEAAKKKNAKETHR